MTLTAEDRPRGVQPSSELNFSAFRSRLAGVFALAADPEEAIRFQGAAHLTSARHFALARIASSPLCLSQPLGTAPEAATVGRVANGEWELRVGASLIRLSAGGLFFLDPGESFSLRPVETARLTLFWSNRAAWRERVVSEAGWHGISIETGSASARLLGAAIDEFALLSTEGRASEADALAEGVAALAACACNLQLRATSGRETHDPTTTLIHIRRFVDRNLASTKLDAAMVARAFGCSRATLYRLFAPVGGLARYIRKARLERARRAIGAARMSDRKISEIAFAMGFRSASVFQRAFLAEYGVTPMEVRAETRPLSALPADRAEVPPGEWAARLNALV